MAPKRVCPLAASVELLGRVTGGRFARPGNPRTKYETGVRSAPEPRYRAGSGAVAALAHAAGSHQHSEVICNQAGQPARFRRLTRAAPVAAPGADR